MKAQRVQQRSVLIPVRRMDEHAGQFVDDDHVVILKDNIQRDVLGCHRILPRQVEFDLDKVTAADAKSDVLVTAIYLAQAVADRAPEVHSAESGKVAEQKLLETRSPQPVGNLDLDTLIHEEILSQMTAIYLGASHSGTFIQSSEFPRRNDARFGFSWERS